MEENKRLDDLLQAAQLEFQQRDEQDRQRQFQLEELPSMRRQLKDKQAELVQQQLAEEASQEKIVALEQSLERLALEGYAGDQVGEHFFFLFFFEDSV